VSPPPTLSVVIPTRDRPGQLGECLAAVAGLDYPRSRFEVVVVDDGGSSDLEPVINRFRDTHDITLVGQRHAGPAAARNAGVLHADGSLLGFIDDDVLVDPRWGTEIASKALAHPGAAIGGRTINSLPENPYASASEQIIALAYRHYNSGSQGPRFFAARNLALPAPDFTAIGGFHPGFRTSEDREFCDRWRESGRNMVYAPAAVARHANPLTLKSFWRQHLSYGRGAFAYHRARSRRGHALTGFEGSFYRLVARDAAASLRRHDLRHVGLLGLWQLANVAGFSAAALGRLLPSWDS
jgi:glycosyltransferase involved in cell wall biosynthesis